MSGGFAERPPPARPPPRAAAAPCAPPALLTATQPAACAGEFLARVTSVPAQKSNPECTVESRVRVKGDPFVEVTYENKQVRCAVRGSRTATWPAPAACTEQPASAGSLLQAFAARLAAAWRWGPLFSWWWLGADEASMGEGWAPHFLLLTDTRGALLAA